MYGKINIFENDKFSRGGVMSILALLKVACAQVWKVLIFV